VVTEYTKSLLVNSCKLFSINVKLYIARSFGMYCKFIFYFVALVEMTNLLCNNNGLLNSKLIVCV